MDNFNYPPGSDTMSAPWNEDDLLKKEVEVLVTMTIYKKVKVIAPCAIEKSMDEDGNYYDIDHFQSSDLETAVMDQMDLPGKKDDWNIDDLIIEEV